VALPRWLLFLVAAWVIAFGVFRIVVALRRRPDQDGPNYMRKGMYGRGPRTHALFGAVYVALGGVLIATALGWRPPIDAAGCLGQREAGSPASPELELRPAPARDSAGAR
jgi:drug/metabolite transporter superfamily protein YnfA